MKPLLSFDIESTGTNVATDRIIQLAITDGEASYEWVCNPGVPIPASSSAIHGFTDADVAGMPPFSECATAIHAMVKDADLVGFNISNFDVPLLWEEFYRCGVEWDLSETKILDAGTLFKRREERTLEAAVKFYLDRELVDAHDALSDATATLDVWNAQLRRYGLKNASRDELERASNYEEKRVDLAGKIVIGKDGRAVYNFGKSKGVAVVDDTGFAYWMLHKDFSENTKSALRKIIYQGAVAEYGRNDTDADGIPF